MCNWIKWIFAGAYVIALLLFALRALDLIAPERDYISGGFLLVLGLPWTLFLESPGQDRRARRSVSDRTGDALACNQPRCTFFDLFNFAQTPNPFGRSRNPEMTFGFRRLGLNRSALRFATARCGGDRWAPYSSGSGSPAGDVASGSYQRT